MAEDILISRERAVREKIMESGCRVIFEAIARFSSTTSELNANSEIGKNYLVRNDAKFLVEPINETTFSQKKYLTD